MEDQTKRGCLTPKLEAMKLTQTEVRLIPYVHYCNINGQRLDGSKLMSCELEIIDEWLSNGDILGDPFCGKFTITKAFFDKINIVLWEVYANK